MPTSVLRRIRAGLLALGMFAGIAPSAQAANASTAADAASRNKEIIGQAFDRWAGGGSDFFNEILGPDVIWTIKGSGPSAGVFQSRDVFMDRAVRPFASRLATPIRPVRWRVWADGDHVIINWDGEGMARDGVPYRNSYAWIFRMRGGHAVEVTAFLDLTPYDDVLRRVPAPVANGERP